MNYTVLLSARARRDLDGLRGKILERVQTALDRLANDPRPRGCVKLTNSDEWRLRVGQYRVRYLIDDTERQVIVTRIGHRREIYGA